MRIRHEHGKHRENGLSISLERDLSTERNLCSAAGAASAPLCILGKMFVRLCRTTFCV